MALRTRSKWRTVQHRHRFTLFNVADGANVEAAVVPKLKTRRVACVIRHSSSGKQREAHSIATHHDFIRIGQPPLHEGSHACSLYIHSYVLE